jgi:DNA-binding NtrC family response regulator
MQSMDSRLMLVDDDALALDGLSQTLRHYLSPLVIETFTNPSKALLRLQAESFAVVLTDFNMPGMNGLRLLRTAWENGSDASFIVMTGDATEAMLTEGLRHGIFGLLNKPLNRAALIPLVRQAVECHRLRREVAALRTLISSGVELGSLIPSGGANPSDLFQPLLPF